MELIAAGRDEVQVSLTKGEIVILINALNEVLHGIDDPEIGTRLGAPSEGISDLLHEMSEALNKIKAPHRRDG